MITISFHFTKRNTLYEGQEELNPPDVGGTTTLISSKPAWSMVLAVTVQEHLGRHSLLNSLDLIPFLAGLYP